MDWQASNEEIRAEGATFSPGDDLMDSPKARAKGRFPEKSAKKPPTRPKKAPYKHHTRRNEVNKTDSRIKRSCFGEEKGRNCDSCEETAALNRKYEQEFLDDRLARTQTRKEAQETLRLQKEQRKEQERLQKQELKKQKEKASAEEREREAHISRQADLAKVEAAAQAAKKKEEEKLERKEAAKRVRDAERARKAEVAKRAKAELRGSSWFSAYDLDSDDEQQKGAETTWTTQPQGQGAQKLDAKQHQQLANLVNQLQMSKTSQQTKADELNGVTKADAKVFGGVEMNNLKDESLTSEESALRNIYIASYKQGMQSKRETKDVSQSKLVRFKNLGTGTLLTAGMIKTWPADELEALKAKAKLLDSKVRTV